jgi:hypothetical protein
VSVRCAPAFARDLALLRAIHRGEASIAAACCATGIDAHRCDRAFATGTARCAALIEISRCRSRSAPKLRSSLFSLIAIPLL